jgi:hypothetical protein
MTNKRWQQKSTAQWIGNSNTAGTAKPWLVQSISSYAVKRGEE